MADLVSTQILVDGQRNCVMEFTNVSDGTGEDDVVKVNPALLSPGSLYNIPPVQVAIKRIKFSTKGMGVLIEWDGTNELPIFLIAPDKTDEVEFAKHFGGLVSPPGLIAGTGKILFTTIDAGATSSYTIVLEMRKKYEIIQP